MKFIVGFLIFDTGVLVGYLIRVWMDNQFKDYS
jgi:hypothetical protein